MNQVEIGKIIEKKRKEKKLSQVNLAKKIGASKKTISQVEKGECESDYYIIRMLCKELGISISEMMDTEENEPNNSCEYVDKQILDLRKRIMKLEINRSIFLGIFLFIVGLTFIIFYYQVCGRKSIEITELIGVVHYIPKPMIEEKDRIDVDERLYFYPELRNGSVTNPSNSNAVAPIYIIKNDGYDNVTINIKRALTSNHKYRFQLTTYNIDEGISAENASSRVIMDRNFDVNSSSITFSRCIIGGCKGFSVAIYEIDVDNTLIPLRIDMFEENTYEVIFSRDKIVSTDYMIDASLFKNVIYYHPVIKLTNVQSFCVNDGKIYSTNGSNIAVQDFDMNLLKCNNVNTGHGNSFQLSQDRTKGFISGWNDNTIYVIDLETLSLLNTIKLPTTGYTTGVVDENRGLVYIFQRETRPNTVENYNFITYDYVNKSIISTKKTVPFGAMQDCDLYADKIVVLNGTATAENPNGFRVYDLYGNVLSEYFIDSIITEYEGVAIDRDTGKIYFSDVNSIFYEID